MRSTGTALAMAIRPHRTFLAGPVMEPAPLSKGSQNWRRCESPGIYNLFRKPHGASGQADHVLLPPSRSLWSSRRARPEIALPHAAKALLWAQTDADGNEPWLSPPAGHQDRRQRRRLMGMPIAWRRCWPARAVKNGKTPSLEANPVGCRFPHAPPGRLASRRRRGA